MTNIDWGYIIAALITTSGVVLAQIIKLRRENTSQHAENRAITEDIRDRLLNIHTDIDHVGRKIDNVAENLERHKREDHGQPPAAPALRIKR